MRSRHHAVMCSRQYEVFVCCVSSEIRTVLYLKSLPTRPVQDGHRKTDWPSEKQRFSL
jgi:hypothetical protein